MCPLCFVFEKRGHRPAVSLKQILTQSVSSAHPVLCSLKGPPSKLEDVVEESPEEVDYGG